VVTQDRVQPAAQVLDLASPLQGGKGTEKGLLDEILGPFLGAEPSGKSRQL
jgi:hypothetical protein